MLRAIPGLLLLTACASDVDAVAVAEVDVAEPAPAPERSVASAVPREGPMPPSKLDGWQLPGSTVALGTTCESAAVPDKGAPPLCGERGKVSIEWRRSALVRADLPCTLRSLEDDEARVLVNARSACIDGDHLVISSHCIVCRSLDAGNAYHARISELGPEQQAYLHQALMLTDEKPTTVAGWRALIERGKPLPPRP